jgi:hypothetical protein
MFFGYLKNQTLASGSNFLETKAMRRLVVGPDASLRRRSCGGLPRSGGWSDRCRDRPWS